MVPTVKTQLTLSLYVLAPLVKNGYLLKVNADHAKIIHGGSGGRRSITALWRVEFWWEIWETWSLIWLPRVVVIMRRWSIIPSLDLRQIPKSAAAAATARRLTVTAKKRPLSTASEVPDIGLSGRLRVLWNRVRLLLRRPSLSVRLSSSAAWT
jgi:hypothetical protein